MLYLLNSFDVWTLEKVGGLVEEALSFNPELKAYCFLNRADPQGRDNDEAAATAESAPSATADAQTLNETILRGMSSKSQGFAH